MFFVFAQNLFEEVTPKKKNTNKKKKFCFSLTEQKKKKNIKIIRNAV